MHLFNCFIIAVYYQLNQLRCSAKNSSLCGDWDEYKNEKCFKLIDENELQTFEDAINICNQNDGSRLVSIHSQEEQLFLISILTNKYNIRNNIWIGAKYQQNTLNWLDNTHVSYTKFAFNTTDNKNCCIQMSFKLSQLGLWSTKKCEKKNLVLCQKYPISLFDYFQKHITELKMVLDNTTRNLELTKNELEITKTELNKMKVDLNVTNSQLDELKAKEDLSNQIFKSTKYEIYKNIETLNDKIENKIPSGSIAYYAYETAPDGWLKANGMEVSRTIYANLFAIIGTTYGSGDGNTTFNLPDLRGEFIRGWSDGKDVDKDRKIGSFQWGSSIPMAGYIDNYWSRLFSLDYYSRWGFDSKTYDYGFERKVNSVQTRNDIKYLNDIIENEGFSGNLTNSKVRYGWNILKGTRPRNIALLACIKY